MPTTPRPVRRAASLAVIAALAVALTACVDLSGGPSTAPSASVGTSSEVLPAPGRTIAASPSAVADLTGYRIAAVVPDDSEPSQMLLAAAREFAADSGADLVEFVAGTGDDPVGEAFAGAVGADADVVIGLGESVVGVFDFETGKILDQEVLVVGGQLAEPTENVTAVIWPGATAREPADEESVTIERGVEALTVGLASIRGGETGVVLSLD